MQMSLTESEKILREFLILRFFRYAQIASIKSFFLKLYAYIEQNILGGFGVKLSIVNFFCYNKILKMGKITVLVRIAREILGMRREISVRL